jgi:hypothetical protein
MNKLFIVLIAATLVLAGCGQATPDPNAVNTAIAETAAAAQSMTKPTDVLVPSPTDTAQPTPTNTEVPPTETPVPTETPLPTLESANLGEIETAFREAGYRRYPFVTDDGVNGFIWVKYSSYETAQTMEDGSIELHVLQDGSAFERAERMERHLTVLDSVLPAELMEQLRQEHATYNGSVSSSVSGEPDEIHAYHDQWNTVWAEYYASEVDIRGYQVRFSLWWWQSTCPPIYSYCYYLNFPGLEFVGDSSFIFHTILIRFPDGGG